MSYWKHTSLATYNSLSQTLARLGVPVPTYPIFPRCCNPNLKRTQFQLLKLQMEPQGRYIFLYAMFGRFEVLILAYYVPSPFQSAVIQDGLTFMAQYPTVPAIWLGDFNMFIDPLIDRLESGAPESRSHGMTRFGRLMGEFALVDTWRHKFPVLPGYSCFSTSHSTMSWIDYIFVSSCMLPWLVDMGYGSRILSDHAPYRAVVDLQAPPSSPTWRLNPSLT